MSALCAEAGMSRQAFYKARRERSRRSVDEEFVLEQVRLTRRLHPFMGARKLAVLIAPALTEAGVEIGRDRLFSLLGEHGLLVPSRPRRCRTTDSRHRFRVYGNKLKTLDLSGPNEAWVSDLTYIRTQEGFVYLSLVTDAWSRKIVGWHAGHNLEAEGCMAALRMALRGKPTASTPIHHSDRGTQYCCHAYVQLLERRGMTISMTQENHCYENAKAERVNGILKQEYGLGMTFRSRKEVRSAVREAVWLYNEKRPHLALKFRFPSLVHSGVAA